MVGVFRAAFIAHVPDADPAKHRCVIRTSLYELTSVLVKDDDEAVEVCKELAQKEGVHAFILCPGFTHKSVARIGRSRWRRCVCKRRKGRWTKQ